MVAFDRELCVRYLDEIRGTCSRARRPTLVMTTAKDDPPEWRVFDRERSAEIALRDRFLDPADPLRFLIVTAKLLAGFDAPVEGVMYLDKPLRAHTLFQAVCRTNRRFTNPRTGPGEALRPGRRLRRAWGPSSPGRWPSATTGARRSSRPRWQSWSTSWPSWVEEALAPFAGVDRSAAGYEQLLAAQERVATPDARERFAEAFLRCEGLFEFLWPAELPPAVEADYRWLARVYDSVQPTADPNALLWHRLGTKTAELLGEYVTDFRVDAGALDAIAIDADTFGALQQLDLFPEGSIGAPAADGGPGARHPGGPSPPQARRSRHASRVAHPGRAAGGAAPDRGSPGPGTRSSS